MANEDGAAAGMLSKADRLAIGGGVAPVLRRRSGPSRRITVVDREGKAIRVCDDTEIAKGVLARAKIEFSVVPGKRPERIFCSLCGSAVKVDRPTGRLPTRCRSACSADEIERAEQHVNRIKAVVEQAIAAADSDDRAGFYEAVGKAVVWFPRTLIDAIRNYKKDGSRDELNRVSELCIAAAWRRRSD